MARRKEVLADIAVVEVALIGTEAILVAVEAFDKAEALVSDRIEGALIWVIPSRSVRCDRRVSLAMDWEVEEDVGKGKGLGKGAWAEGAMRGEVRREWEDLRWVSP